MIIEIEKPIDTSSKISERKSKFRSITRLYHKAIDNIKISLEDDPLLIEELAEEAEIEPELAEKFLTVLFQEIKRNILNGNVIKLINFGTFYINGPHRDNKGKIVIPLEIRAQLFIFFKPTRGLKLKMRKQEESNM